MKTFRVPLAILLLGVSVGAQDAPRLDPTVVNVSSVRRTAAELEQLMAPIALYPDVLIALILPAATVPTDIVLAARHLQENPGDRSQIEHRAWDESVKSLTNYPEVLKWMDENLLWTRQVGEAFTDQPAEVMQAVQRLRAKATAAGTLVDTPQQQVIAEPQVIRIVPAQPDIIYVPHYEPDIVFVDRPIYYGRPFLTFGVGVPIGSWLAFDCDWRRHSIWVGNRHRRWTGHDWHRPVVPIAPSYNYTRNPEVRQWRPSPQTVRTTVTVGQRFRSEVVRPAPFGLAATRSNTYVDSNPTYRRSGANPSPAAPVPSRSFTPGFNGPNMGPRTTPQIVNPPVATPQVNVPAPAPTANPAPATRRSGRDDNRDDGNRGGSRDDNTRGGSRDDNNRGGSRDDNNRSRSFRNNQNTSPSPTISAPPTVVPPLPAAPAPRSIQPGGQMPQRSYSRGAPPSDSAPAAAPVRNRSAPPAAIPATPQVAPATPPPAPQQQAAPAQNNGGESRGHRGAGYRRDN